MRRRPSLRLVATLSLVAASLTGCFALFSLDGYGPAAPAEDASDATIDGLVEAGEAEASGPPRRIVFVTSTTHEGGSFGGLAGADAICAKAAAGAKLPGTYR